MAARTNTAAAKRFRPGLLGLEDRTAPAAHTWIAVGAGNWSNPASWAGGDIPTIDELDHISITFATASVVNVDVVDNGLVVNELIFPVAGTNVVLNTDLRVGIEDFVQTISGNGAGNQINGTGSLRLIGNQDVGVANGSALQINAPIVAADGFVKAGGGTLVLGNSGSSLGGTTSVFGGTLAVANNVSMSTLRIGDDEIANGVGTVAVDNSDTLDVVTLLVQADGVLDISNAGAAGANTVTLGSAEGGGLTQGMGVLRVGPGGLNAVSAPTASRVESLLEFNTVNPGSVVVANGAAATDLFLSGRIQGNRGFDKSGPGTLRIDGLQGNTFTGTVTVSHGLAELGGANGVTAIPTGLDVTGSIGQPAAARLLFMNVIADGADVTVGFLGSFDQNGRNETFDDLRVRNDGVYNLGNGGALTLNGNLTLQDGTVVVPSATVTLLGNAIVVPDGVFTGSDIVGGTLDLGGGTRQLTVGMGATLNLDADLSGGTLAKDGPGTLLLPATGNEAAGLTVQAGSVTLNGLRPSLDVTVAGGFLGGAGAAGDLLLTGGTFQPGTNGGDAFAAASLTAGSGAEIFVAVFGPNDANQIFVNGQVELSSPELTVIELGQTPAGSTLSIGIKTPAGGIIGTFAGTPEGTIVTANGTPYRVSYVGGNGNDLTLTTLTATQTVFETSADIITAGDPLTVTATVTSNAGVPTGSVRFTVDGAVAGTVPLDAQGMAAILLPNLAVGQRAIEIEYLGGGVFAPSTPGGKGSITVNPAAVVKVLTQQFAVGAGADGQLRVFNPDGTAAGNPLTPFAGFAGGVRTAVADFNGDGTADYAVGAGPGSTPRIMVIDGQTGAPLFDGLAFEASFGGGVYVAAGDLTGDGLADLVVTPDEGGGPRLRVLRGGDFQQAADFFGIDDPAFRGGARAAVGDVNGDGRADLIVSAGFGGGPRVAGYDGLTVGAEKPTKLFADFFVFEEALRNGAFVAVGDLNADGFGDLTAGAGPGGGPRVLALSGADLMANASPAVLANFFAGNPDNRGGVRVTAKNLDGDARADLVVGDGDGAGSRVTAYRGKDFAAGTAPEVFAFDAFPGLRAGVFVG